MTDDGMRPPAVPPEGDVDPRPFGVRRSTIALAALLVATVIAAGWAVGPDTPWAAARRATTPGKALAAVAGDAAAYGGGSDACSEGAIACVLSGANVVYVAPEFADVDDDELQRRWGTSWTDVMRHEYMHVLQHRVDDRLWEDAEFVVLFGEPPVGIEGDGRWAETQWHYELSAECMAEGLYDDYVRAYPGACTPEQSQFAADMVSEALDIAG